MTRESISLKNRIVVEIHTASFRTTRGYTIVAALLDELAYWPTDESAAAPDVEVINAIKPGMATIAEAMLLCLVTAQRRGALWDAHRRHFAKDNDPILVWQAATRDMNPAVPQSFIEAHLAEDPARAQAEYLPSSAAISTPLLCARQSTPASQWGSTNGRGSHSLAAAASPTQRWQFGQFGCYNARLTKRMAQCSGVSPSKRPGQNSSRSIASLDRPPHNLQPRLQRLPNRPD